MAETFTREFPEVDPNREIIAGVGFADLDNNNKSLRRMPMLVNVEPVTHNTATYTTKATLSFEIPDQADYSGSEVRIDGEIWMQTGAVGNARLKDTASGTLGAVVVGVAGTNWYPISIVGDASWRGTTRSIEIQLGPPAGTMVLAVRWSLGWVVRW